MKHDGHASQRVQVAFLTGRSRPGSCALSPEQSAFLENVTAATGVEAVSLNYPYRGIGDDWRPVLLPLAAMRNGWQFLRARRDSAARRRDFFSVCSLVQQAGHTVFLAGSCGLELLASLDLPAVVAGRCSYLAYGPVARSRPACGGLVVRGSRDWVDRPFRIQPDHTLDCGHMGFLQCPDFHAICVDFIRACRERLCGDDHVAAF